MTLVAYDDSGSEDNQEIEDYNHPAAVSKTKKPTVKIGLPFNSLVSLRQSGTCINNSSFPISETINYIYIYNTSYYTIMVKSKGDVYMLKMLSSNTTV